MLRKTNTVIERDRAGCLKKMARCLKPLFKDKIINFDMRATIWCNFIFMLVLFALGIVIRMGTSNTDSFTLRFDDKCGDSESCSFPFIVKRKIKGPIFMYLHFKNFYVQHRMSLKSMSHSQLKGNNKSPKELEKYCKGMKINEDFKRDFSFKGDRLDPRAPLNPCGIYATLFPEDDFLLEKKLKDGTFSKVAIQTQDIANQKLREKYQRLGDGSKQWADVSAGNFG